VRSHSLVEYLTYHFERDKAFKTKCQMSTQAWLERKIYSRVFSHYVPPVTVKELKRARKLFFAEATEGLRQIIQVQDQQKSAPEFRDQKDVDRVQVFVKDIADQACKNLLDSQGYIRRDLIDLLGWGEFSETIQAPRIIEEILISYIEAEMGELVAKTQQRECNIIALKDTNQLMYLGSCISRIADASARVLVKDSIQAAKKLSADRQLEITPEHKELAELKLQFARAKEVYVEILDRLSVVAVEVLAVNPTFEFKGNQQEQEDFAEVVSASIPPDISISEQTTEIRMQILRLNQFIGNATLKLAEAQNNLLSIQQAKLRLNSILTAIVDWEAMPLLHGHKVKYYPGDPDKAKQIKKLIKTGDLCKIIDELSRFIQSGRVNHSLITSPVVSAFKCAGTIRSVVLTACGLGAEKRVASMTLEKIAEKLRKKFNIEEELLSRHAIVSPHRFLSLNR
jgi:hypothetical protein